MRRCGQSKNPPLPAFPHLLTPSVEIPPSTIPTIHAVPPQLHTHGPPFSLTPYTRYVRPSENPTPNLYRHPASPTSGLPPYPLLETTYRPLTQHPCGFVRLIHSSTHNEYYYWNYLSFHSLFLEAFLPPHAFNPHANTNPHNAHRDPKYSQPRDFAESLSTP